MKTAGPPTNYFSVFGAGDYDRRGVSFTGAMAFILSLSVVGSGFAATRFRVAGLLVHPYLFVVAAFFPVLALTRLGDIPRRLLFVLLLFSGVFFASTFAGGISVTEGIKIGAVIVTILTMMMLVDRFADFELGAMGLIIATSLLAGRGLSGEADLERGFEVLDSSNRNTYSLYALPAILMAGQAVLSNRSSLKTKVIFIVGIVITSLVVCLNLNRSGWLGLAIILLMLFIRRRMKALAIVALVGGVLVFLIGGYYGTEHLRRRFMETKDNRSDAMRTEMIRFGLEVAIQNPMLGVSPRGLQERIANHFGYTAGEMSVHNVYVYLAGGSGFVCLLLLFLAGKLLWSYPYRGTSSIMQYSAFKEARRYVRMMLFLWLVRGLFSHEILYSPAFCMGIGLCAGLCKASLQDIQKSTNRAVQRGQTRPPRAATFT